MLVQRITTETLLRALRPLRPWLYGAAASDLIARHRTVDYLYLRPAVEVGEAVRVVLGRHSYLARVTRLDAVEPNRISPERARADGFAEPIDLFWSISRQSWPVIRCEEPVWRVGWRYLSHGDLQRLWPPSRVVTVRTPAGAARVVLRAVLHPEEGWLGEARQMHDLGCGLVPGRVLVRHVRGDHYLGCLATLLSRVETLARQDPDWLVDNDTAYFEAPMNPDGSIRRPASRTLAATTELGAASSQEPWWRQAANG